MQPVDLLRRAVRFGRPASCLLLLSTLAGCTCGAGRDAPTDQPDQRVVGLSPTPGELIQAAEWRRRVTIDVSVATRDQSAGIRARAALAIGRIGDPEHSEQLFRLLTDGHAEVRAAAAFALRLLAIDDQALRLRVARAFAARLAGERDAVVRQRLIVGLGWTDDGAAREQLRPLISSADTTAALTAWGLLGQRKILGPKDLRALVEPLERQVDTAPQLLAAWAAFRAGDVGRDPRLVAALQRTAERCFELTALKAQNQACLWAVRALGGAIDPIWFYRRLTSATPRLRVALIDALAHSEQRGGLLLARALPDLWRGVAANHHRLVGPELHAVLAAVEALGDLATKPTVIALARQLLELSDGGKSVVKYREDEAHSVDLVHCAAAALIDRGLRRVQHSAYCGTSRSTLLTVPMRRAFVARLIGKLDRQAKWKITLLERYLLDDDPLVREAAVASVAEIDDRLTLLPLTKALEDKNPSVLGAAAEAVKRQAAHLLGQRGLVKTLSRRLAGLNPLVDPEVSCSVIGALGKLRDRQVLPQLVALADSSSRAVRTCARQVLDQLGGRLPRSKQPWPSRALPDLSWAKQAALPKRAVIVTPKGEITIELFSEQTPATVANFARLAARRFYRGLVFHRVVPNFVVQGGDPQGTGWGGPGYTIPCELTPRPFERGSVGMALAGRDTGGSQFFIAVTRQPHLDGRYTQFGRVIAGMDVVDRLQVADRILDVHIPSRSYEKRPSQTD
ncbi:MAG: peptidylprolyl isomerase [Deltaproteobacteria bacterium]|nr:peptidylprolyl isomerase [Deltaproteobacteria bacterium]